MLHVLDSPETLRCVSGQILFNICLILVRSRETGSRPDVTDNVLTKT